ncbi:MAG: dockerin type I domain-containing protein [Lachnospiraceae bacterium]|nr:dockerin type I domain-containing protein [Lachnospiraceae bacterium]
MRKKISLKVKVILASFLLTFVAVTAGVGNVETYAIDSQGRCQGVDVSSYNATIDWNAAKADGIDFAIIRIGFGDDDFNQDDSMAIANMAGCEAAGIPYGVYIYSYAISEKEVISEANHTLRMIKGHNPKLGIWYDMEDADYYKDRHNFNPYTHGKQLTNFCIQFMDLMKANGYSTVGVYANRDYFTSVLDYDAIRDNGLIWLAHWGISSPSMDCDIWQYSDSGKVKGIPGYGLDMDMIYPDSTLYHIVAGIPTEPEKPSEPIGGEVLVGERTFRRGDVNHDNTIDVIDLALVKKSILGKTTLEGETFSLADVNNDGVIDVIDLALVKKHILGKIDLLYKENVDE